MKWLANLLVKGWVEATKFVKTGATDDVILLGAGGTTLHHKEYGIGEQKVSTEVDFNLYIISGFYITPGSGLLNAPTESQTRHNITVGGGVDYITQTVSINGDSEVYFRRGSGGVFTDWVKLHHSGNFTPTNYLRADTLDYLKRGGDDLPLNWWNYGKGDTDETLWDYSKNVDYALTENSAPYETQATNEVIYGDTDHPFGGGRVIETSSFHVISSDFIPVTPGETIYGEMFYKLISGTGGTVYYGVKRYDSQKRPIGSNTGTTYFVAANDAATNTTWTKYSGKTTIPETHAPYTVNGSTSDGGGCYYVVIRILLNYNEGGALRRFGGFKLKRIETKHDQIIRDSKISIVKGADTTEYHSYGIEFKRAASYLRSDTNGTKDLFIGSSNLKWENIFIEGDIHANNGNIYSNKVSLNFLSPDGTGLPINTNELLVSSSYSDRSKVPTNGAYVLGNIVSGGGVTCQGLINNGIIRNLAPNGALQRADSRDESTTLSRLHKYGWTDTGATSNFREAWYDGTSYINVTSENGGITFGGNLTASKVYATGGSTSLRSLKKNIKPFTKSGLNIIKTIEVDSFDYKDEKMGTDMIGPIYDEAPSEIQMDGKYLNMYNTAFVTVKAVQELSATVEKQQKQIDRLEKIVEKLISNA